MGLIVLILCPSQKSAAKRQGRWTVGMIKKKEKRKCGWVVFGGGFFPPYSIFFPFFQLNKLPGSKRESGGRRGRGSSLEWGDSLIRGVHADETYLGRPCVRGAPKLPVLKHWLAVSSVFFAWIRKGCCAFHLVWANGRRGEEGKWGGWDCFASFLLFFSVWGDRLQSGALSVCRLQIRQRETESVDLNVLLIENTNPLWTAKLVIV